MAACRGSCSTKHLHPLLNIILALLLLKRPHDIQTKSCPRLFVVHLGHMTQKILLCPCEMETRDITSCSIVPKITLLQILHVFLFSRRSSIIFFLSMLMVDCTKIGVICLRVFARNELRQGLETGTHQVQSRRRSRPSLTYLARNRFFPI